MSENLGHVDLGLLWKDGGVEKRKVGNKKIKWKQGVSIEEERYMSITGYQEQLLP